MTQKGGDEKTPNSQLIRLSLSSQSSWLHLEMCSEIIRTQTSVLRSSLKCYQQEWLESKLKGLNIFFMQKALFWFSALHDPLSSTMSGLSAQSQGVVPVHCWVRPSRQQPKINYLQERHCPTPRWNLCCSICGSQRKLTSSGACQIRFGISNMKNDRTKEKIPMKEKNR